jgi:epoxyqueuosine reductase QueG
MSELVDFIKACAAPHGLNLIGAIPIERYDLAAPPGARAGQIDPRARSIVVIGNGGGAFWQAYRRHLDANPGWERRDNPLDDFTRQVIERDVAGTIRARGLRAFTVYPFVSGAAHTLHFQELGRLAGIGGPSIIGVLVHPVYGPWIAFRAAILLEEPLDEPGDAIGFDPCPACTARSCIPACPVGAVSAAGKWDAVKCVRHRVEVEPDCAPRCHSRAACVLGPQHRYPDDALSYHQERALRSMREYYRSQWGEPPGE